MCIRKEIMCSFYGCYGWIELSCSVNAVDKVNLKIARL